MSNFIKLRYTFFEKQTTSDFAKLFKLDYLRHIEPVHLVCGYETMNNRGELTHPHIHIHFSTDKNIAAIRKALTRMWAEAGEDRKRAALYSLKLEEDVKDPNFFYRYPLKQGSLTFHEFNVYPPDFDFTTQRLLAQEQWSQICEVNNAKALSDANKQSTYDKLEVFLKEKSPTTKDTVLQLVLQYYKENRLAMNLATMSGYALTFCALNNLVCDSIILQRMNEKFLS